MNKPRLILQITIAIFMIVTVIHVAFYSGSFEPAYLAWLGVFYAVAVELSIVVCAYFTTYPTSKVYAWSGFFLFTAASGVMNWGWIEPATFPAGVYAVFPTVAIGLLGFLYRQASRYRYGQTQGEQKSEPSPVRHEPKANNYRTQVFALLEQDEQLTQAQIVERTGASKATVSKWVNVYQNNGGSNNEGN